MQTSIVAVPENVLITFSVCPSMLQEKYVSTLPLPHNLMALPLGGLNYCFGYASGDYDLDNLSGTGWRYCNPAPVTGRREGWVLQLQAPIVGTGIQNTRIQYFFEYDGSTIWRRIRQWDNLTWKSWAQI